MPTYDYQCELCAHQEEVFQKITDEPLKECPACKKEAFRRLISGGGTLFRFKGSGFYLTDYCKKSASPSESPPSSGCACKGDHHCG